MEYLLLFAKSVPVTFAALLPVINPVGTAIILLSMTGGATEATQRSLAKTIALNTVLLLTVILLGGSYLLEFFGISVPIVQAAGGFVLAAMGWNLLNQRPAPPEGKSTGVEESSSDFSSRAFYPFTFPICVGPGSVAVTLTLSAHTTHGNLMDTAIGQAGAFVGILGIAFTVYLAFAYGNRLAARLGPSGTAVLMRLIAFIVVCIGAEISWSGIRTLLTELPR